MEVIVVSLIKFFFLPLSAGEDKNKIYVFSFFLHAVYYICTKLSSAPSHY